MFKHVDVWAVSILLAAAMLFSQLPGRPALEVHSARFVQYHHLQPVSVKQCVWRLVLKRD
ncbi:MAG: hypothetical protein M3Y24_11465 [Acidobacteriota bacterium]|nr:hypothetical protein [Acidobacteriota bacterium]